MPSSLPEEMQYAFKELCRYLDNDKALDQANITVTNFRARGLSIMEYDFIEVRHSRTFEQELVWIRKGTARPYLG